MSKESLLPNKVDPFRFADNEIHLEGKMLVKEMERLRASLKDDTAHVTVNIAFGVDEEGIRFMRGDYSACLVLECQRCLGSFPYTIAGTFQTGIVHTEEEAERLPKAYDPVMAKDGMLAIQDVIEDELIIGLPIVPMHNEDDCKVALPFAIGSKETIESTKENPFKVIELLRSKRNSNK